MGLSHIWGQEPAVHTLQRALEQGRVHHAYRFEGPDGVGKEMAAFALAQALLCERPSPVACEKCGACERAVTLTRDEPQLPVHPDVVLVERGLYKAALIGASEATSISVEQVRRNVLRRAGFGPHEGKALVFIIRNADELTTQAANALLKTLEEPGPRIYFVLLSSRPNRLLDTVRSRTLSVRFGPLPDSVIERILAQHGLPTGAASLAQGSAALALELGSQDSLERREAFLHAALLAVSSDDLVAAIRFAENRPSGRDELISDLAFVAHAFASEGREAVESAPAEAVRSAERYQVVLEAIQQIEANAQAALVLEAMIARLRQLGTTPVVDT